MRPIQSFFDFGEALGIFFSVEVGTGLDQFEQRGERRFPGFGFFGIDAAAHAIERESVTFRASRPDLVALLNILEFVVRAQE